MRIVIDARYVNDHFPGIGRYVYNLLLGLAQIGQPHDFIVLCNPALPNSRYDLTVLAQYSALKLLTTQLRPFSVTEQIELPRLLRSIQPDLFHAPYYVRPYIRLSCPSMTTLYDVIPRRFPAEVTLRARLLFDLLTRLAIHQSQHLLAISSSARDDLIEAYGIPFAQITITPLAADPRMQAQPSNAIAAIRAKYGLAKHYVLSLSANKPHKNLVSLIEAWAQVQAQMNDTTYQLVLAGHWDARYPEARNAVERLQITGSVYFLPNVAEEDLPALYSGAEVFAFPSRYEGFGLPPLEAMACGAPVLCCDTSSLPEVVGDAALLVRPTADALAVGLTKLLSDARLRAQLHIAGHQRAAQFTWQQTAQTTLAAYEYVRNNYQTKSIVPRT